VGTPRAEVQRRIHVGARVHVGLDDHRLHAVFVMAVEVPLLGAGKIRPRGRQRVPLLGKVHHPITRKHRVPPSLSLSVSTRRGPTPIRQPPPVAGPLCLNKRLHSMCSLRKTKTLPRFPFPKVALVTELVRTATRLWGVRTFAVRGAHPVAPRKPFAHEG